MIAVSSANQDNLTVSLSLLANILVLPSGSNEAPVPLSLKKVTTELLFFPKVYVILQSPPVWGGINSL